MKQSVKTGEQILAELRGLEDEIKELEQSLDAVGDQVGTDSRPYGILKELWDKKTGDYNWAKQRRWVVRGDDDFEF